MRITERKLRQLIRETIKETIYKESEIGEVDDIMSLDQAFDAIHEIEEMNVNESLNYMKKKELMSKDEKAESIVKALNKKVTKKDPESMNKALVALKRLKRANTKANFTEAASYICVALGIWLIHAPVLAAILWFLNGTMPSEVVNFGNWGILGMLIQTAIGVSHIKFSNELYRDKEDLRGDVKRLADEYNDAEDEDARINHRTNKVLRKYGSARGYYPGQTARNKE